MITRIKVTGFKNLVDFDARFGPFTCIAGANGVGKSNIFDAIIFLSNLAEKTFIEAALSVRGEGSRVADVRHLFHRAGNNYADQMSLEVEMIIPRYGMDDYGQTAEASITSLRYSISLAYREKQGGFSQGPLELIYEKLEHIKLGDASKHFLFPLKIKTWRNSALLGRRVGFFISTKGEGADRIVQMHQDSGGGETTGTWRRGAGRSFPAASLPRTVLSSAINAVESPTALLVRREMQSWRLLQLEPSALRKPDEITAPRKLSSKGSHLPATLYRLAGKSQNGDSCNSAEQVYAELATHLSELINDVQEVRVDRDEKREILTLQVIDRNGTAHPARSLSDGTLRFLALSILGMDSEEQGLLCFEEPENGIHPERIPAMIQLLGDIATDTNEELGPDNPLNQVIVNTHSPTVVGQIPDDSLLIAELKEYIDEEKNRYKGLSLSCLDDTWRAKVPEKTKVVSKGKLLSYLNPIVPNLEQSGAKRQNSARRVVDREDMQQLFLPGIVR